MHPHTSNSNTPRHCSLVVHHPVWSVLNNKLHLELLEWDKSYIPWGIQPVSRSTVAWTGSRWGGGLENWRVRGQNPSEPFQCTGSTAIHLRKCFGNQVKDVILQAMDPLSPCLVTIAARIRALMLLFLLLGKGQTPSSHCFLPLWSADGPNCSPSHCSLIRVLLNHRNMPKSSNSNNRNKNKHSFVCSRVRGPRMP